MPIVTATERTPEEFALFAFEMNQLNPNGFRQPGRKSLTLMEHSFLRAGLARPDDFATPHGPRRERKLKRRKLYLEALRKEREEREIRESVNKNVFNRAGLDAR